MNVYSGYNRRQVGGGVWTTIQRGIQPFLENLYSKMKPHAMSVGKSLLKRARGSAMSVGTNVALDALSGNLNKKQLKSTIMSEVDKIKSQARAKVNSVKRAILDDDNQEGRGNKRRRTLTVTKKKKAMKRTSNKRRSKSVKRLSKAKRGSRPINKRTKRRSGKAKKVYKRKAAKKSHSRVGKRRRSVISRKAILDIFGK